MDIEFQRVSECTRDDVIKWLTGRFTILSKDFGNKLTDEDLTHLSSRTYEILYDHYRGMHIGDLKPIFFNGMSGLYGGSSRLTVQTVLLWLKGNERSKIQQNASRHEAESGENSKRYYNETYDRSGEFVLWLNRNNLDYPDNGHPVVKGQCSAEFIEYREMYHKAKNSNSLNDFKDMLIQRKSILGGF